jgi:hypothetical protein
MPRAHSPSRTPPVFPVYPSTYQVNLHILCMHGIARCFVSTLCYTTVCTEFILVRTKYILVRTQYIHGEELCPVQCLGHSQGHKQGLLPSTSQVHTKYILVQTQYIIVAVHTQYSYYPLAMPGVQVTVHNKYILVQI